jgi:hypothetical protein
LDNKRENFTPATFIIIKEDFDKDGIDEIFSAIQYGRLSSTILRLVEKKDTDYFIKDRQDTYGSVYHMEVKDVLRGYRSVITEESACFGTGMGCKIKTIYTYIDGRMIETWRGVIEYHEEVTIKINKAYTVQFKDINGDGQFEIVYTGKEREEEYNENTGNWDLISEKLIVEIYKWVEGTKRYEKI